MNPSTQIMTKFYQELGKLFFAIAYADKKVHPAEVEMLNKIVKENWLPLEDTVDRFGTDTAFQIETVFDWLVEQDFVPYDCFEEFKSFKKEHPSLFTDEVRQLIWNTADRIASAFAAKNKSELVALSRLRSLLLS